MRGVRTHEEGHGDEQRELQPSPKTAPMDVHTYRRRETQDDRRGDQGNGMNPEGKHHRLAQQGAPIGHGERESSHRQQQTGIGRGRGKKGICEQDLRADSPDLPGPESSTDALNYWWHCYKVIKV